MRKKVKIKLKPEDVKFSKIIRTRDEWRCQRCHKQFHPPTQGLHCSHFHGRAKLSTRYDLDNCVALCYGCHAFFTANPLLHTEWFQHRLGQERFDRLHIRARTLARSFDWQVLNIWLRQELKKINGK